MADGRLRGCIMLQQVLAQPKWADKLTRRGLRALTPLS